MKGTEEFKKTIQNYLEERAQTDELFAAYYAKEEKNIDDCIAYIMETVKKSECCGFTDEEVFSMAVHYYNEDDIKVGELPKELQVVVNHHVELTEEDKKEARQKAIEKYQNSVIAEMKKKANKPNKKPVNVEQPSLFDE